MKRLFWKFYDAGGPGAGGGGGETPEQILLGKIKAEVETRTKGMQRAEEVQAAITAALVGLNLEGLRKFDTDKAAIELQVRNLAAEFEKIKKVNDETKPLKFRTQPLKDLLDKNMDKIGLVMNSKQMGNQVTLNTRAAADMTTANTIDETVIATNTDILESFSVDAFVKKRRPVEYIFEIANRRTVTEITEYKTWLEEGDEEGAFAIVAEGAVKPLVSKSLVRNISKYRKLAGKRVYTEEFAKFRKEAYNILEDLFNDQLIRNYAALLVTSLEAAAAAYVGTALDGQYTDPTDYHAIGAVAAQIESVDFFPDLLIINPQDKWRIALQQNSQGSFFVNIPMYNPDGVVSLMGFRVFTSNRVDVGTAILGESKLFKIEDEPVSIRLGYGIDVTGSNPVTAVTGDFDNNRFRIIAETYFHDYIATNHAGSFVVFDFADVKAALTSP